MRRFDNDGDMMKYFLLSLSVSDRRRISYEMMVDELFIQQLNKRIGALYWYEQNLCIANNDLSSLIEQCNMKLMLN